MTMPRPREWTNGSFALDRKEGILYATRGQWTARADRLAELTDDSGRNVSAAALSAAVECGHASLEQIQEATTHAMRVLRVSVRVDWENTRRSMSVFREHWPGIVDEICKALRP